MPIIVKRQGEEVEWDEVTFRGGSCLAVVAFFLLAGTGLVYLILDFAGAL